MQNSAQKARKSGEQGRVQHVWQGVALAQQALQRGRRLGAVGGLAAHSDRPVRSDEELDQGEAAARRVEALQT